MSGSYRDFPGHIFDLNFSKVWGILILPSHDRMSFSPENRWINIFYPQWENFEEQKILDTCWMAALSYFKR